MKLKYKLLWAGMTLVASSALVVGCLNWKRAIERDEMIRYYANRIATEERAIPLREKAAREKLAAAGFTLTEVSEHAGSVSWTVKATRDGWQLNGAFSHERDYYLLDERRVRGACHYVSASRRTDEGDRYWYYQGPARLGITHIKGPERGSGPGPVQMVSDFAEIVWQVYADRPWPQP